MGFFKKALNAVKNWVMGGSSKSSKSSSSSKKSSRSSSSSNSSRSTGSYYGSSRSAFKAQLDEEERKRKEKEQQLKNAFKAKESISAQTTSSSSSSEKKAPPDPKQQAFKASQKRVIDRIGKMTASQTQDPKEELRKKARQKREVYKATYNKDAYNKATKDKYNVEKNGSEARRAQKSQAYDVNAEKYEMKAHPIATSAGRGALSGVTMGGSELMARTSKNRKKSGAEEFYQKNKSAGAESLGEIAGSLASFGLTNAASTKAVGKLASKAAPKLMTEGVDKAAVKLASSQAFKKSAKKELMQLVKDGGLRAIDDKMVERYAVDKARRILGGVGSDIAVNWTTGGVMDATQSIRDAMDENGGEFDWRDADDWRAAGENYLKNRALNYGLGAAVTVAPALRSTKGIINRTARDEAVDFVRRIGAENAARDAMQATFTDNAARAARVDMNDILAQQERDAIEAADPQARLRRLQSELAETNNEIAARSGVASDEEIGALTATAEDIDAQIMDYFDEMSERATTVEDFQDLFGLDRATAEILANDKARAAEAALAEPAVEETAQNGIPVGNIRPLSEAKPKAIIDEVSEATAKATSLGDLTSERDALKREYDEIVESVKNEHGDINPDYTKLTPEQRESVTARKRRMQEIQKRQDELTREIRESRKNTPIREKAPREDYENIESLEKEYRQRKAEYDEQSRAFRNGDENVNAYDLEREGEELQQLKNRIDDVKRDYGEKPKGARKTRSDKGVKRNKPKPEIKAEAEPKPTPEVKAEAEPKAKVEGEPATEAVKAQKAAEKVATQAEANANDKPLPKVKKGTGNAKAKTRETVDTTIRSFEEEQRVANRKRLRLDREFEETRVEFAKLAQSRTKGEFGVRQSVRTAERKASDVEAKRLAKKQRQLFNEMQDSGMRAETNEFLYRRFNEARQNELFNASYDKALKEPKKVFDKLKAKVDSQEIITLNDVSDMLALEQAYDDVGRAIPPEVEEVFTKLVAQGQTEHAQLLKGTDIMLKRFSPKYRKQLMKKDLERFREVVCNAKDWTKISESLDANHGVDDYLTKRLNELAYFKGNSAEFKKAYSDLCKEIYRNTKPTLWDTLNLVRHSFMLGSFKTIDNNLLGNMSQRIMYGASDKLNIVAEHMLESHQNKKIADVAKKSNALKKRLAEMADDAPERKGLEEQIRNLARQMDEMRVTRTTTTLKNGDLRKLAFTLKEGKVAGAFDEVRITEPKYKDAEFAKQFNDTVHEAVDEAMGDSKHGFHSDKGSARKDRNVLTKGIQALSKGVGFMLNEPDRWFVESSFRTSFARYLQANGVTSAKAFADNPELIKQAKEHALDVALENTYKKNNRLVQVIEGQRAKGYKKGSKLYQKMVTLGLDAELPYLKVPTNMVVNSFKYSPVGLLKSAGDAGVAMAKGDVEGLQKAANNLSKGLTGTGLFAVGFYLNCQDQEDDDAFGFIAHARDELKEYNIRDNSFMINGKNYNIANLGMGSTHILMGARYAEELNLRGGAPTSLLDDVEAVLGAFNTSFDVVADTSLMDNATGIFDAVSNQGDYDMKASDRVYNLGLKIVSDYTGQYANPAVGRALARGMTDADLDAGVKKGSETTKFSRAVERNKNNVINSIPVLNEKVLPHKVDRHGNLINERKTTDEKAKAVWQNFTDPFSRKDVNIPEADKVELSIKKENGEPYQPKHFDENRTYQAKIGQGSHAELIDLTGKEREQAARSYKRAGYDMAHNLVFSTKGWFGDSHGERAQGILNNIPEDEEKAREYLYNTPEFKKLGDEDKVKFLDAMYNARLGRGRTANEEVYVNIKGGSEGDFRFQNDLHYKQQDKYYDNKLEDLGVTKEQWADVIDAAKWESHKYTDEGTNRDTINSAYKLKTALLNIDGLSAEQRVAIYQAFRGKRNGFGWYDWDGNSLKGYYRRRGYRRWRRWGRRGGKAKTPALRTDSAFKAKAKMPNSKTSSSKSAATKAPTVTRSYKSMASSSGSSKTTNVNMRGLKLTPPTPKTKKKGAS